jgi:hypothetical protein
MRYSALAASAAGSPRRDDAPDSGARSAHGTDFPKRMKRWPWLLGFGVLGLGYAFNHVNATSGSWTGYALAGAAGLLACAVVWLAWQDRLRKLTVLCYDLDETTARAFESFTGVWRSIATARSIWEIPQAQHYADRKYHGGASIGVQRKATLIRFGAPENVRCNVDVPMLNSGAATIALYPDRLLVFRSGQVGAVPYSALQMVPSGARFNEEEAIPSDAQVVGQTWRYVNKSGGPDRRFKDNRQIPVCAYSELEFKSDTGLSACFMASKPGTFDVVPKAIELLRVLERHSRGEISHATSA